MLLPPPLHLLLLGGKRKLQKQDSPQSSRAFKSSKSDAAPLIKELLLIGSAIKQCMDLLREAIMDWDDLHNKDLQ